MVDSIEIPRLVLLTLVSFSCSFLFETFSCSFTVVFALKIMIIQGKRLMGGRVNSRDQFRDWRLDVDNMSYEVCSFPIML